MINIHDIVCLHPECLHELRSGLSIDIDSDRCGCTWILAQLRNGYSIGIDQNDQWWIHKKTHRLKTVLWLLKYTSSHQKIHLKTLGKNPVFFFCKSRLDDPISGRVGHELNEASKVDQKFLFDLIYADSSYNWHWSKLRNLLKVCHCFTHTYVNTILVFFTQWGRELDQALPIPPYICTHPISPL